MQNVIEIYCDGSITKNPNGRMRYAFVCQDQIQADYISDTSFNTNWVAEFTAVLKAMEWALSEQLQDKVIVIYSDLVAIRNQLNKSQNSNKGVDKTFYPIKEAIFNLKPQFSCVLFKWIPREKNIADKYANQRKNG